MGSVPDFPDHLRQIASIGIMPLLCRVTAKPGEYGVCVMGSYAINLA
jgi:hypothetical protein